MEERMEGQNYEKTKKEREDKEQETTERLRYRKTVKQKIKQGQ